MERFLHFKYDMNENTVHVRASCIDVESKTAFKISF
jgi:hypothetical protein